jgi:hypothetical protein
VSIALDAELKPPRWLKKRMAQPAPPTNPPVVKRRRRWVVVAVVVAIVAGVFLALVFVPYNSVSKQIQVTSGSSATTSLSIPQPGWVTIHFDHPYGMGMSMHYWMQGSGGMMYDHSMMGGGDSYSFWSWGGSYECGAGYAGTGPGMMTVWVNATWGML